jgi:rhamnosyltransferase subunit B
VNILLIALGSHGDVHPFVGIGLRLRERGHQVAVAANEYFKPLIDHANLEFVEVGTAEEYRTLATNPDLWHPLRAPNAVFSGTARYLRRIYDIAADFGRRADSVVAASTLAFGARVAQDAHTIPLATVHLSPSVFLSIDPPPVMLPFCLCPAWTPQVVHRLFWRLITKMTDGIIGPALNALRDELKLAPVRNILRDYWHSPQRVIGLFPDWFGPQQRDWPRQTVLTGFPLFDEPDLSPISPELDAFLRAGEAPIAFTPGSAMWQAKDFFDSSVEACVRLKRHGILLSRHPDHLPQALPPGVIHVQYAPFSQLLPRCAAFVHHGGIGSSAQALARGVPQLVTPFAHDQPDNADRLTRLGVAETLPARKYKSSRIVPALERLLNSSDVAQACRRVKERFVGVDPLGQTCDLIEALRSPAAAAAAPVATGTA